MTRFPSISLAVAMVAVGGIWLATPALPCGFAAVPDSIAASTIGGACKNELGLLVCGTDITGCVEQKGRRIGNSECNANEVKFACIDPTYPASEEEIQNCGHTHKKCSDQTEW